MNGLREVISFRTARLPSQETGSCYWIFDSGRLRDMIPKLSCLFLSRHTQQSVPMLMRIFYELYYSPLQ